MLWEERKKKGRERITQLTVERDRKSLRRLRSHLLEITVPWLLLWVQSPAPPHSNRQTNTQTETDRQTQRKPTEIFRVFPLVLEFITSFQSKEEILRLKLKIYNFL